MITLTNWPTNFLFMPKIKEVPGTIEEIEEVLLKKGQLNFIPPEASNNVCHIKANIQERMRHLWDSGTVIINPSLRMLLNIETYVTRPAEICYEVFCVIPGNSPTVLCVVKDGQYENSLIEILEQYTLSLVQDVLHRIRMFTSESISAVYGVIFQQELLSDQKFLEHLQEMSEKKSRFCNPVSLSVDKGKLRNISLACLVSIAVRKDGEDYVICCKDEFHNILADVKRDAKTTKENTEWSSESGAKEVSSRKALFTSHEHDVYERVKSVKQHYIKTSAYRLVKRKLKQYGHVTITGFAGEGKTMMSLMIASHCVKHGYDVVFVNDIAKFSKDDILSTATKTLIIFDELFGRIDIPKEVEPIKKVLDNVASRREKLPSLSALAEHFDRKFESYCPEKAHDRTDLSIVKHVELHNEGFLEPKSASMYASGLFVILTSKKYNLSQAQEKFKYHRFDMLQEHAIIDFTMDAQIMYNLEEKKKIFNKHRELSLKQKIPDSIVEDLCNTSVPFWGFPLLCKLYFTVEESSAAVFHSPLNFFTLFFKRVLDERSINSAILLLIVISENQVNLRELEESSDVISAITDIMPTVSLNHVYDSISRKDNTAANLFLYQNGTLSFSHTVLYDTCTCAVYEFSPSFLLNHCSLDFLFERIKLRRQFQLSQGYLQFINISADEVELVLKRLIHDTNRMENKTIAPKVIERALTHLECHDISLGKSEIEQFLSWIVDFENALMIQQTVKDCKETALQREVNKAIIACSDIEEMDVLIYLFQNFRALVTQETLEKALTIAVTAGSKNAVGIILQNGAKLDRMDIKWHGISFLHIVCYEKDTEILEKVMQLVDITTQVLNQQDEFGLTPIMLSAQIGYEKGVHNLIRYEQNLQLTDRNGNNLFHLACMGGSNLIIEDVMKYFDINSRNNDGMTAAMIAVQNNNEDLLKFLLQNNANFHLRNNQGENILHIACHYQNISVMQVCLKHVDINSENKNGITPIMIATACGYQDTFDYLISSNADINKRTETGKTLLHLACQSGNKHIISQLLPLFAINCGDSEGCIPIMTSALCGKKEVFEFLLSNDADITAKPHSGDSLLHLACQGGNVAIVKHLLPFFDINLKGMGGCTSIMKAAICGKKDVFEFLVSQNADITTETDSEDNLLHLACQGGNLAIVKQLLPSFDINLKGMGGCTSIMKAAICGKKDVFEFLVSQNADITTETDSEDNLLHLACQGGNLAIVKHLLPSFNINVRGMNGHTPVMNAVVRGKRDVFQLLLSHNADIKTPTDSGDSLLHLACQGGNLAIVKQLLPSFDINLKGMGGCTSIMKAAICGKKDVFEFLVSQNADIIADTDSGDSLLHLACQGGNMTIVKHLLPFFDINLKGMGGCTPIMLAAQHGKKYVFDLLLSENPDIRLLGDNASSLFHFACQGGDFETVEYLLPFFEINKGNEDGITPAMFAASHEKEHVLKLLIAHNADLTCIDKDGNSVLHHACRSKRANNIKCLLPMHSINSPGMNGWTPVMLAAFFQSSSVLQFLLESKADTNRKDQVGDDILYVAQMGGDKAIIQQVMKHLHKENIAAITPWTKILVAAVCGDLRSLKFIGKKESLLYDVDAYGDSLLHLACRGNNSEMVEYLLKYIDVNIRGRYQLTPVMLAAFCGQMAVFDKLVKCNSDLSLTSEKGDIIALAHKGGNQDIVHFLIVRICVENLLPKVTEICQ